MKRIIVTGAGGSASTNFIESLRLAKEKFYIVGTDISKYYLTLSKADVNYLLPSCREKGYIESLNKIIDEEHIDFVHCQPDTEVEVLVANKNKIRAKTLLPTPMEVHFAHDKFLFNLKMRLNGVPCPQAWRVDQPSILKTVFREGGSKWWLRATVGAGSLAALPVTSAEQTIMWIDYWTTRGITWGQFMISEYLPGKEYAFQSLWKDGELITSAARQRIEYLFQNRMPSGQSSTPTIAKSVHNDMVNQVATHAIMALTKKPHGVYCVDLKENENGLPCVMEINIGRFFTTSLFFTALESNMPYYFVKLGFGEKIPILPKYNAVRKDFYWIRQIDMGHSLMREGEWNLR